KIEASSASVSTSSEHVESVLGLAENEKCTHVLDVLLEICVVKDGPDGECIGGRSLGAPKGISPAVAPAPLAELAVIQVAIHCVASISAVRLNLPKDLRRSAGRQGTHKALKEVRRRFDGGETVPLLDPVADLGIRDEAFQEMNTRAAELRRRLTKSRFHDLGEDKVNQLENFEKKMLLLEEARKYRQLSRETQTITMRDELRRMRRVLRRLGYTTAEGVLETKGRFACELNTADEILMTDMVFDGIFNELSVEQTVALLSCFVHSEPSKAGAATELRKDLQPLYQQLQTVAQKVARARIDAKITVDEEAYFKSFNPELMEVAFAWASGAKFVDICRLTDVFEGSIIREIRRLEESLRQLASASLAIGNVELKDKFETGADRIRRGVVFTASLYL
ncbi:MTREX, partial [Symbiodinium microadriaticum]